MRRLLPWLALPLVACKGSSPEKELVGTWSSPQIKVEFAADRSYKASPGEIAGTWAVISHDVTLTTKSVGGRPVADLKAVLQKSLAALPANQRPQAQSQLDKIDQPTVATLSEDGKTLTPKSGPLGAMSPLTKS